MKIYCCGCQKDIEARLTDGREIYPHRPDLYDLPFWKCNACKNFVGCHHKTKDRTKPLGCIATPEILKARKFIHGLIDPLWQKSKDYRTRGVIYGIMAEKLGVKEYHNAELRTIEEAIEAYKIAREMPKFLHEKEIIWQKVKDEYLKVKPVVGNQYLVYYGSTWQPAIFQERKKHSCSLHGEPYLDYYFRAFYKSFRDDEIFSISISADLSLKERTEKIKQFIKKSEDFRNVE